jgi:hypothetical protein
MLTVRAEMCRGVGEPIEVLDIELGTDRAGVRDRTVVSEQSHGDLLSSPEDLRT